MTAGVSSRGASPSGAGATSIQLPPISDLDAATTITARKQSPASQPRIISTSTVALHSQSQSPASTTGRSGSLVASFAPSTTLSATTNDAPRRRSNLRNSLPQQHASSAALIAGGDARQSTPRHQHQHQQHRQSKGAQQHQQHQQQHPAPQHEPFLPPVAGRVHMDIQTDTFLEELADKIPEAEHYTQTDAFYDRPATPLFVPKSSGVDASTQIMDGDLFDFDREVEPMLEILVGKTLEQAFFELHEETELAQLRRQQAQFAAKKRAEQIEVQRLEAAEKRRDAERERRMVEQIRLRNEKEENDRRVAAQAYAADFVAQLIPSVMDTLVQNGLENDARLTEVQEQFAPWLTSGVQARLDTLSVARSLLDSLILSACQ